eukprot:Gb_00149 [translate_table: standard]
MDSRQLLDSLADHVALYHRNLTYATSKSQSRQKIVQWTSSLTTQQRQAALTTVDEPWLAILLQMQKRILTDGPGFFIVLPDVLVSKNSKHSRINKRGFKPQDKEPLVVPSLCYRKARGLLARVNADNEAEQILNRSLRMFSSREGEFIASECPRLDSLTVSEDLVEDLDRFIAVMDAISNGEFLNSANPPSASSWEELPWLEAKGFYSLSAFVANKLELSLRLSWLNAHGRNRTSRMHSMVNSHETYKNGPASTGFASTVFWRKKGCVDWWCKVDTTAKAKAFKIAAGKAIEFEAKQLVGEVKNLLKTEMQVNIPGHRAVFTSKYNAAHTANSIQNVSFCDNDVNYCLFSSSLCGKPSCCSHTLSGLYVLQEVSALGLMCASGLPENDMLFFSTLSSVHTVLDCIMRRVREAFEKVSKDSIELDLMGDEKPQDQSNHCKVKDAAAQRKEKRRKGRSAKKKIPITKQPVEDASATKLCEEQVKGEEDNRWSVKITENSKPRKGQVQSAMCEEENRMNRLQSNSGREQLVPGGGEGQVKSNKQGKGRSKSKKKDTSKFDAALLLNKKERELGANCDEPQQQAAVLSIEIQRNSSLEGINCNGLFDISSENVSSQNIHFVSSPVQSTNLCGVDNNKAFCNEQLIKYSDSVGAEIFLPKTSSQANYDSSIGSTSEKASEVLLTVSHVLCKSDLSDISGGDLQKNSSTGPDVAGNDMGKTNFISRDCGSTTDLVVSSCDNYFHGGRSSSVIDSIYPVHVQGHGKSNKELGCKDSGNSVKLDSRDYLQTSTRNSMEKSLAHLTSRDEPLQLQGSRTHDYCIQEMANFMPPTSYEWPSSLHFRFPPANAQLLPAATDRLHLDVDWNWRHHLQPSLVTLRPPWARQPSGQGGYHKRNTVCQNTAKSLDWPPVVQTGFNLTPSIGYSHGRGVVPFVQSSFQSGCTHSGMELNVYKRIKEDAKYEATDETDCDDLKYSSGDVDDFESYFISEDEAEKHPPENACNGADYNQVFGGGVMYWNTADYAGTGCSRPPSLSSEDSSWARHEADLNVVIDDIISLPQLSGPYGSSGVASPPTSFLSPFDQFGSGAPTTPVGFMKPGNDFNGKFFSPSIAGSAAASEEQDNRSTVKCSGSIIDGIKGEVLPHPILRPIVIPNMSRQGSRTDFTHQQESRSPCIQCNRREPTRVKRPPSPVVLCVPPAPPPPPPSPVGGFRKQRRFPTVRSGSSSPRHWGISSWPSEDEMDRDDHHVSAALAWRSKCLTGTPPMHPLSGALLRDRLIAIPQSALEQEHPDIALPLQSVALQNNPALQASLGRLHNLLHEEIESFCKQVATENLMRKPFINAAVKKVARALQVLWPRSRIKIFGSNATGLALPTSDVDLVVCLPPVRNLEPIKEAGILEGRNGIKETCLQHAARYLANQEWVKSDSLKTIENTAIPIIILVVKVLSQLGGGNEDCSKSQAIKNEHVQKDGEGNEVNAAKLRNSLFPVSSVSSTCETWKRSWGDEDDRQAVRLDISFESSSHTGLQTAELVKELTGQFPAIVPLALVLKQFLTDRSLDHPYSGGLSSYCLVLLITRFLQHQHHTGRSINQDLGSLFMDFLYFFGCVFDPRQMRVSIRGSGMYVSRDRGQSIDPLHIDDPLHPLNNVGRNCFRIHQCIKAFADAHSILEKELVQLSNATDADKGKSSRILPKLIPSVAGMYKEKINF